MTCSTPFLHLPREEVERKQLYGILHDQHLPLLGQRASASEAFISGLWHHNPDLHTSILRGKSSWAPSQALVSILSASSFSVGSHLIVVVSCFHLETLGHPLQLKHIRHKEHKDKFNLRLSTWWQASHSNITLMFCLNPSEELLLRRKKPQCNSFTISGVRIEGWKEKKRKRKGAGEEKREKICGIFFFF